MSARWYGTLVAIGSACASQATARPSHWQAPAMANCASAPAVGHPTGFRHLATRVAGGLGEPRHRGADVIATESEPQVVRGVLAYTAVDKAAEDEDIEVYACTPTGWRALGTTRTDDDGRFALTLAGDARLPIGLHALAISVVGDRSGAELTALIAPRGTAVAVSDVDGTLTSSENAIVGEVVLHRDVAAKPDAGAALQALVARGLPIVYLTVRARRFDQLTHRWLASHGMPRGPILEAESITLPGRAARDVKVGALAALRESGFEIAVGLGNRATDVDAYEGAGVPANRIFVEGSQYGVELRPLVAAGRAIVFTHYAELRERIENFTAR